MPAFDVRLKATLEGVASISVGEAYQWRLRLVCACSTPFEKTSVFSWDDSAEVPGGTGTANLVQKCKACSRVVSVELLSKAADFVVTAEAGGEGDGPVVATLECRGATPVSLDVGSGFVVTAAGSPSVWTEQDLSCAVGQHADGWCEFDEEGDAEAGGALTITDVAMTVAPQGKGKGKKGR
jgi:hypothetical protein